MKKSKKFLSVLCAVCMMLSISAPAFAAENVVIAPRTEVGRVVINKDISGSMPQYSFSATEEEPYFRFAIYNDMANFKMDVQIYKEKLGGDPWLTTQVDSGKWSPNVSYYSDSPCKYIIVLSRSDGGMLSGKISVRVSPVSIPTALFTKDEFSIAYMDINAAPVEMKNDILKAREAIIFGDRAWTVDGAVSIANKGSVVQKLPEFSDLFPGWDIPTSDAIVVDGMPSPAASTIDDEKNASLVVGVTWANSKEFYTFSGPGGYVYVYAKTSPADDVRFNIGFSKAGTNVGWCPNISMSQAARIDTKSNVFYGIRGSVSKESSVGNYRMVISSDPGTIKDFIDPEL